MDDPSNIKRDTGSVLDRDLEYLRRATLEESIAYAYKKKRINGPLLDMEWYSHAERNNLFINPSATDHRVVKIAAILRALRFNNVSYAKSYALKPTTLRGAMSEVVKGTGYFIGIATPNQLLQALISDPHGMHLETLSRETKSLVAPYLVKGIDEDTAARNSGLISILVDLDKLLPEISWARYPFFAINSKGPFMLGIHNSTLETDNVLRSTRINRLRYGMTGLQVLQFAIVRHLSSSLIFQFDPMWVTTLTIIAYAYIRATMTPGETRILDVDAPRRVPRQNDDTDDDDDDDDDSEKLQSLIPGVLRSMRASARREHMFIGLHETLSYKLMQRLQHEMMAIRKRDLARVTDNRVGFLYPYGHISSQSGRIAFGVVRSGIDPALCIREIGAIFSIQHSGSGDAAFEGPGERILHHQQISQLSHLAIQNQLRAIGKSVLNTNTARIWIGADPLKEQSWRIAIVLVVLALRTPSTEDLNNMLLDTTYPPGYGEYLSENHGPDRHQERWPMARTREERNQVREWYRNHLVTYVSGIWSRYLVDSSKHWGMVAYVAYFIHSWQEDTLRDLKPLSWRMAHNIFVPPERRLRQNDGGEE